MLIEALVRLAQANVLLEGLVNELRGPHNEELRQDVRHAADVVYDIGRALDERFTAQGNKEVSAS